MKIMKKNKMRAFATCVASAVLGASALLGGAFLKQTNALAEENTNGLTAVPQSELVCLSDESATMFYSNKTGSTKVRYTATADYSLDGVTDIAVRLANSGRQVNKANTSAGLTTYKVKFKDNDTVYNVKNEQYILGEDGTTKLYTHFTTISSTGTVKNTFGITGAGQLSFNAGFDGTVYIPLDMMYDGKGLTDDKCLTSATGYSDFKIEYVEFEVSTYRWDLIVGDMALIKHTGEEYTETVMGFTKAALDTNSTLLTDLSDTVGLVVNDTEAVAGENGGLTADLPNMGTVSVKSDKLRFFKSASISSALNEGYGITNIQVKYYDAEGKLIDAATTNPLGEGYVFGGNYFARTGDRNENTATIGNQPVKVEFSVVVSPLVKLTIDGEKEGAKVAYGKIDDSTDGVIYLAKNQDSTLTVTPIDGFDFTGAKLDGAELTNASSDGTYSYVVKISAESVMTILGIGEEVTLGVSLPAGTKATVSVGDKTFTGESEALTSNLLKKLTVKAVPDAGYTVKVEKVVAATETEAEQVTEILSDSNHEYVLAVDGAFTVRVTTQIVSYQITYRLNGGALAEGESNPETLTILETVVLKAPAKDNYDFMGWRIEGEEGYITELKNVSSDLTVIAEFKRVVAPDSSSGNSSDNSSDSALKGDSQSSQGESGAAGTGCGSLVGSGVALLFAAASVAVLLKKKNLGR